MAHGLRGHKAIGGGTGREFVQGCCDSRCQLFAADCEWYRVNGKLATRPSRIADGSGWPVSALNTSSAEADPGCASVIARPAAPPTAAALASPRIATL